ncbi:MAG: hypothetical protein F4W95_06650 [Chloroflexi bacterium]|nr:hypothetical protein [Chloroflexota bacterium]MYD48149.1 hypothetical protein [Chloroflexota bacterium]
MSGIFGLGSLATWALLHVIVLLFAWGYSGLGDAPKECVTEATASWACGTPFEAAAIAEPQETNFFAKAAGVLGGVFKTLFGFLTFDYPILAQEGVMGVIGTGVRIFSWMALLSVSVSLGLRLFGRG